MHTQVVRPPVRSVGALLGVLKKQETAAPLESTMYRHALAS